jgi:DNA-binding transcriptional MerR regulator
MSDQTIDELAASTGTPTRTIREYQRLGLLPPPRRDGRVGRYGAEHRARLTVVERLQARGYSLAAIGDLVQAWELGRGLGSVLGTSADPAVLDEAPTVLTTEQLVGLVPAFADDELLRATVDARLVHRDPDGTCTARSLATLELVGLAVDAGIDRVAAIGVARAVRAGARRAARTAVDAAVEQLWPRRDEVDLPATLTAARLLLAQAAASWIAHELGEAIRRHRDLDAVEAAEIVESVSIGRLRRLGDAP